MILEKLHVKDYFKRSLKLFLQGLAVLGVLGLGVLGLGCSSFGAFSVYGFQLSLLKLVLSNVRPGIPRLLSEGLCRAYT